MKKLASISAFSLLVLFGCQRESLNNQLEDVSAQGFSDNPETLYLMGSTDGSAAFELLDLDQDILNDNAGMPASDRNGNTHVNGRYTHESPGYYKTTTVQFAGTENNQGTNGVMHIWRTWGDNGEFSFHLILDVDCIQTNEAGDAVVSGIVTKTLGTLPILFGESMNGYRIWTKVGDRGQGNNAPPDQYHNAPLFFNPSGTIPCAAIGVNAFIWRIIGQMVDIQNESDYINVN